MNEPKVAIVCDWLTNLGGAEKVVFDMHVAYPNADIYTSIYNPSALPQFEGAKIFTSFLQNMPFAKKKHFLYLPLMPHAFESFDLSEYDIVISSSFACAKGVITKPDTLHICYCHTPMRYVWDQSHEYIKNHGMNPALKKLGKSFLHRLRQWDKLASERVDYYIANSAYISEKIKKYYGRDSVVIHPGVNFDKEKSDITKREDYYMSAGRLKAYKRFDLVVKAFNETKKKLYIIGTGEELENLKKLNINPNTHFLGFVEDKVLKRLYRGAKGFIFPQCEDFGITPIEAQHYGCPLIALRQGGVLETVKDGETGVFFDSQDVASLVAAINKADRKKWDHKAIQKHSRKFTSERFRHDLAKFVAKRWDKHSK